jgi:surface antigen
MLSRKHLIGFALLFATPVQAADPCVAFYGRGYCTDYVNSKISNKQRGNAENWRGGLPRKLVRRGDVAIFRGVGHVAYVEDVVSRDKKGNPSRIRISEWNWAAGTKPGTPASCRVTRNFGVQTVREIDISKVDDFYGPTYKG